MKKLIALTLSLLLIFSMTAVAEEYVIKYPTHQIGTNTSAPANAAMVASFNEKYAGTYRIEVEEVPGDTNYRDKILTLLQAGDLPALIYSNSILDTLYNQGVAVDLTPYLEADPEWRSGIADANLLHNTRDGKVIAVTNEGGMIGYYYNKAIFEKCGIAGPAKTWDEFFEICQILKDNGVAPISMMTGDNAWCSGLVLSAMVDYCAGDQTTFMEDYINKCDNYNVDYFIKGLEMLKRIWDEGYTTDDSIGSMYENAAINFISGKTAMIANGTWMIGSFSDPSMGGSEEFAANVGIALYPNDYYISYYGDGFVVTGKDDMQIEAGIAMLKHWTATDTMLNNLRVAGLLPGGNLVIPDDVLESNPILGSFLSQTAQEGVSTNLGIFECMYPNVDTGAFAQYLTLYVQGYCTAEELAQAMTEEALANK